MHVLVIAEAGVNHNGKLELAYKLIDAAKEAGADIVKFQTGIPEKVTSRYALKAEYQKTTTGEGSQLDMIRRISLKHDEFIPIKKYCEKRGIRFLSTPFDIPSIDFLSTLDMDFWKIPSGEITNYPYLVKIANTGKDIVLSTGMSTMQEVKEVCSLLRDNGAGDITLLHCTTEYPAPYDSVNLLAMCTMKDELGYRVGYSDHTQGIEIPIAAVAMGASVIEKHFTLDRNMDGPDHKASLEPDELAEMIKAIRKVEQAMGNGIKAPSAVEEKNIAIARKSIIAARAIMAGEELTEENITTKRPGNGITPMMWNKVLGTKAIRNFAEDELIEI